MGNIVRYAQQTVAQCKAYGKAMKMQQDPIAKSEAFPSYFDFCVIDGTPYLQQSYALRYEVYCNEQHFLAPEDYPSGLEIDAFDNDAIHIGAINREGVLVGTVRLVLPTANRFPLFEHCQFFSEHSTLADSTNPIQLCAAEISRLAVSKSYRRRANDGMYGLAETEDKIAPQEKDDKTTHRRHRPELVLGLYRAMYRHSKRQGITHWFAAMEKTLLRLLHRYQFGFEPIGPEIDYYGPVTPYLAEIAKMEKGIRQRYPELYAEFVQGLAPEFLAIYQKISGSHSSSP